ncbi:MAG: mechanosensitive ion channel domain-containing protein, partial [Candidatus Thermoplasmatota archaeon]
MGRRIGILVLVLVAFIAPAALAASDTAPVLIERADAGHLVADKDQNATATFTLFNLNPTDDFYVSGIVEAPPGWSVTVVPNKFFLQPRTTTNVSIIIEPAGEPAERSQSFQVTFSLVQSKDGAVTKITEEITVVSGAPPRVLGLFSNPLSSPFDNAYGTFLLNVFAWVAISVGAIFVTDALIRSVTARASGTVTHEILVKLRRPIFLLVFFYGVGESVSALPRNPIVDFINRFAVAIAVGVFGLYVLYKVLDSALFYYQLEIAPKTETKMDDVLVPVIRKIGVVSLYGVGIILTLKTLGWDPTIIFAGAGIAGIVIAFAAQDTFSNLFSGVFLMLDQPFVEGDIILLDTGEVAKVENIGLRTTRLYEYDHHHTIIVPNNQLATKRVVNYSAPDSNFRVDLFVGVGYDADPAVVERILMQIALSEPELVRDGAWAPIVQLRDFADSAMTFMLRVTVKDARDKGRVPS